MEEARSTAAAASGANRFTTALKQAGLKLTAQRRAICEALASMEGKEHPTVQQLYDAALTHSDGVSLATVYNTLTVLKDQGALYELGPDQDGAVHYELDTHPHINVVCLRCRRIVDVAGVSNLATDQAVAAATGFQLLASQVLYHGYCPECRAGAGHSH